MGRYKKLSVTMPAEVVSQLDEWAAAQGMSRSEALRYTIREALKTWKKRGGR